MGIDANGDLDASLLQGAIGIRCEADGMEIVFILDGFLYWGHVEMGRAGMIKPVISGPFKYPDDMWCNIVRMQSLCHLECPLTGHV